MPNFELGAMPDQISAEVIALLEQAGTATMGHWRYWGLCDRRIQPVLRGRRVAGTAVTVAIPGADSTLLHHALGLLRAGDVLVVDRLGDDRHACWSGDVTVGAKTAGAKAGVVDGPCANPEEIEASDLPVWSRGVSSITTRLLDWGGRLNRPISVGGVVVMPGDAVLCDDAGVVVLTPGEAESEARRAIEKQARGLITQDRVARGEALGVLSGATATVLARHRAAAGPDGQPHRSA